MELDLKKWREDMINSLNEMLEGTKDKEMKKSIQEDIDKIKEIEELNSDRSENENFQKSKIE